MAITVLRVDGNVISGDSQTIDDTGVDTGVIYNGMAIDTGGIAAFNAADIGGDAFAADSLHNNTEALGPNTSISVGGTALAVAAGAKTFTQNTTGTPNGAGYAVFDVSGLDQVTPFREAVRNSYNAVAPPALNYSVDAGGLVVLLASTNINSNDVAGMVAAGWTQAGTSKAISNITDVVVYYRIAGADEPTASIAPLMTSNSGRGFSILWVYNAGNTSPVGVTIDSVDGDDSVEIDQSGITILGSNFEAVSAEVIISPTDDIDDLSAANLTPTAWADGSIDADMPANLQMLYGTDYYIFVRTDSGEVNAAGKLVDLIPPTGNTYLIIQEQNDLGVLLGVTGLEFGADQLEYQATSLGGGIVYIGFSGVVYVYGYAGSIPSSDTIYVRLGDASDQTWSDSSATAITITGPSITLDGDGVSESVSTGDLTVVAAPTEFFGDGVSTSSSTADLATEIPLLGVAVSSSSSQGDISTSIDLTGAASSIVVADGGLLATINLSGAAINEAISSAGLDSQIQLLGDSQSESTSTGELSGSAPTLAGNAISTAESAAELTIEITMKGSAISEAVSTADLNSGANLSLAGQGFSQTDVTGDLVNDIKLGGNAISIATSNAGLTTEIPLSGIATGVSVSTGDLVVALTLNGDALSQVSLAGDLTTGIQLSGNAIMESIATGNLTAVLTVDEKLDLLLANQAVEKARIDELWQLAGLDIDNPMSANTKAISSGSIEILLDGDGVNSVIATRQ